MSRLCVVTISATVEISDEEWDKMVVDALRSGHSLESVFLELMDGSIYDAINRNADSVDVDFI